MYHNGLSRQTVQILTFPIYMQGSNVFAGKHGLITPRDLFKWANRGAVTYEELAQNGFMVLGERLRSAEEQQVVQSALQTALNIKVALLYSPMPQLS